MGATADDIKAFVEFFHRLIDNLGPSASHPELHAQLDEVAASVTAPPPEPVPASEATPEPGPEPAPVEPDTPNPMLGSAPYAPE